MTTLGSPGVQVNVIDESFYTPAAPATVPLIFVASAQNKNNASGTGTAQGTLQANAGNVYVITSQRDLTDTFGTPYFETDAGGNSVHGSELNEYGLQAAYSLLGVSSRAYIARADIDLGQLVPVTSVPTGNPVAGTYWVDTADSMFGINEWSTATNSFTVKTPIVIDDTTFDAQTSSGVPTAAVGQQGDYAIVLSSYNGTTYPNALFYKTTGNEWIPVDYGFDGSKRLVTAPHTLYPDFATNGAVTGSVWVKTTSPGNGSNWVVKYYNGSTASWTKVPAPLYSSTRQAIQTLDYAGGGQNIAVGTIAVETDPDHYGITTSTTAVAEFRVWRRANTGATTVVSQVSTYTTTTNSTFSIRETLASTSTWGESTLVTIAGSGTGKPIGQQIPAALSGAGLVNMSATFDITTNKVTFKHALGGEFELQEGSGTPLVRAGLAVYNVFAKTGCPNLYTSPAADAFDFLATNWKPLIYEAKTSIPVTLPEDGKMWYNNNISTVDIMVNDGLNGWVGYRTKYPLTDPEGPLIMASMPVDGDRSDQGNLVENDIWISTGNTEMYGKEIYVYNGTKWTLQDVTDQTTPNGWVFADARWADAGSVDMSVETSIKTLLLSDYVDPDCEDPALYPTGTHLWNTRRSGNNVKKYIAGYINLTANSGNNIRTGGSMANYVSDRWVTLDGINEDGSGKFGRYAQRGVVIAALKAMIDTNSAVRDTDTLIYNLMATPGYPEAIQNMIALNTDIGQLSFVVGDAPFRLQPNGTALTAWGSNSALAFDNGDEGATSYDQYMAFFYPSGFTNDNRGNSIVVPPSHMMLRTIINSDAKSYQWFAPAGTNRGTIDNASSVGYITAEGEFKTVSLYQSLRDVLQSVKVNPIATLPGAGLVNMGQNTRAPNASALDRINVVRLISYLRRQLTILAKPFLFEPNDGQTRREMKAAVESLMLELVGQRALYDFIVVCDGSNNTPARIDRSELWVDIAIEPVKAVEFIYIPLRILNTGAIASGNYGSSAA